MVKLTKWVSVPATIGFTAASLIAGYQGDIDNFINYAFGGLASATTSLGSYGAYLRMRSKGKILNRGELGICSYRGNFEEPVESEDFSICVRRHPKQLLTMYLAHEYTHTVQSVRLGIDALAGWGQPHGTPMPKEAKFPCAVLSL